MQTTQVEMPTQAQAEGPVRELDSRVVDGLQVQLLWCEPDGPVFVRVEDQRSGEGFSIPVKPGQSPQDVFTHPFAYAPAPAD